ncbi:hypothetical protein [Cellulomonas fimi]|uniref:Uncharacterized protein n=1 Tax=Cellulomonas fimi TaxID=1708 RepID=A0A7Y0LWX5_CELFI|nr:hypothetical protein [Cellulomonas fimi]NMR19752.1 hypothetical protein [Cellulomonas fimi]
MTSSSSDRDASLVRLGVALVVGLLVAVGMSVQTASTRAGFSGEDTAGLRLTTRPACVGSAAAYTSGMIDAATPALRWSFSGALPADATAQAVAVTSPGLLVCDPAQLAPAADVVPGALALDATAPGSALTAATPVALPGDAATLLLWVSLPVDPTGAPVPADGELASVVGPDGALVLRLTGGALELTHPSGSATTTLAGGALPTDGAVALVAVSIEAGAVTLGLALHDGAPTVASAPTSWTPGPVTLTVGARAGLVAAPAVVDEVTLLTGATDEAGLRALVAADDWWTEAPYPDPAP